MKRRASKNMRGRVGGRAAGTARPPRPNLAGATDTAGLFLPQGYEPGYAYPLVVWLPDPAAGEFDLGRAMARTSLRNFVAVVPRLVGAADADVAVWRAVDRARLRASIHPDRIYLVGLGGGGSEAFRIACRHAAAFAGVASLDGRFPCDEPLFARIKEVRKLPMLLCCGRDDEAVAVDMDRTLRLFHAAGGALNLRIYPSAGPSRAMLADVNRWIMEDVCGAAVNRAAPCAT